MVQADGTIRTDEMSLTAVLILHGYMPAMERGERGVEWVIRASEVDEFAEDLVAEFQSGACRVEPVRFMRTVKQVREDLYKFLGHSGQPKRTPVPRRATSA